MNQSKETSKNFSVQYNVDDVKRAINRIVSIQSHNTWKDKGSTPEFGIYNLIRYKGTLTCRYSLTLKELSNNNTEIVIKCIGDGTQLQASLDSYIQELIDTLAKALDENTDDELKDYIDANNNDAGLGCFMMGLYFCIAVFFLYEIMSILA